MVSKVKRRRVINESGLESASMRRSVGNTRLELSEQVVMG